MPEARRLSRNCCFPQLLHVTPRPNDVVFFQKALRDAA
jgi:hypothetical protein